MALAGGTKLGPYEIVSPLGAGGMGEVYLARDTRLDRTVAIKILPMHLSENVEAKQRFDREARALSSLSHPNICHLYDVGQQDGTSYLVMEYLEGETLADRLRKGGLPLEKILKYGIEICKGLEKAHRSGVVHRDLKPSNIMLTKSGVKLMDFGLAKPPAVASGDHSTSDSLPTMSRPLTAEDTIVGTFQYMSPEQVEGKEADPRSDIFSLGAILYEMVTGNRAFEGKTTASTIAAILATEPKPISTIQPMFPAALEHVTKACLAKDADERLQSAHDVKVELHWIAQTASQSGTETRPSVRSTKRERVAWFLVGLLLLVGVAGAAWWVRTRKSPPTLYFSSPVPFPSNDIALAPDGRLLAIVGYSDQANQYMIWMHEVGGRGATSVPRTEGASHPFWSPDGRSIGFFAQGKLKRVDVFSGTSPQVLCDAPKGRGGAWNREGTILFTPNWFTGLYRVSSLGGTPIEVTKVDQSRFEQSHRWPVFLPDGRHFLYLAANFSGHFEKNTIFLGSLDSDEKRPIVNVSSNAVYADPGYLLYLRDNALVAQQFDHRSYILSGEPHTITEDVQYFPTLDLALFDVAGKKTMVMQPGRGAAKSQLTWFDRSGKPAGTVGPPGTFAGLRLSPDDRRVAIVLTDLDARKQDIWIRTLTSDTLTRFTFWASFNTGPIWSPDGRRIVVSSNRKAHGFSLYQKNADGTGSEKEVADLGGAQQLCLDWSQDGKYLLVNKDKELWYVSLQDGKARPLLQAEWTVKTATFSPDGKWVAYSSNETGSWEVYVTPFPNANSKWQVSREGGDEPQWKRDGKELFYLSAEGKMMTSAVKSGSNFEAGQPIALFQTRIRQPVSFQDVFSYDVTGDGQRFLINTRADEPNAAPLSVILNWASELEK